MLTDYILTLEALQVTQIQPNFPYSKMGNVFHTIENSTGWSQAEQDKGAQTMDVNYYVFI